MEKYNNITEQSERLAEILRTKDLAQYKKGIWDIIDLIVFNNPSGVIEDGIKAIDMLFHMPTALFWYKMEKFLRGTFYNYEEQVKFASRFNEDNKEFAEYVRKLMGVINSIDEDEKIDYVAKLTRCLLLYEMEMALYFRLMKFIQSYTADELLYLKDLRYDQRLSNSSIVSLFILQGIIVQEQDEKDHTFYVLSSFGNALKRCSLNFDDNVKNVVIPLGFNELKEIEQKKPITWEEVNGMMDSAFEQK